MKRSDVIDLDDLTNWKLAAEASKFTVTRRVARTAGDILCVEHVAWNWKLRNCGEHLSFPENNLSSIGYIVKA